MINRLKALRLLLLSALLVLCSAPQAAAISVTPERNPIFAGEEFTLTFSTDTQPNDQPDFTPLRKDFDIVSTGQSTQIQVINGVPSRLISWKLRLFPKVDKGVVKIPAIQFGSDSSHPLNIIVKETRNIGGQPDTVIVEVEADPEQPYVQQQVIITQRLLHNVNFRRSGASMTHPEISEGKGIIQPLENGRVRNSTVLRNGIQYKVSERRYALFAQNSGNLTIGRTVFQGVLDDGRQRDPFSMGGRQLRRFSKPLELDIKEQPASGMTWLPARNIALNAYWQVEPDQLKTGEPVTLTLAVMADGLMAEQLPELTVKPPKGIKAYSNQPELRNNNLGNTMMGTRQEKWILIATAPGEYALPAMEVRWWNLETGQPETATIAATQLTVSGEVANGGGTGAVTDLETMAAPDNNTADRGAAEDAEQLISAESADSERLPLAEKTPAMRAAEAEQFRRRVLLIGSIVLGLGAALVLLLRYRRRQPPKSGPAQASVRALEVLQQACHGNEAQKAYDALSDWVRQDLQLTPPTIAQLRHEADLPLKQALDDLSMALYARQHAYWEGQALWQSVQSYQQSRRHKPSRSADDLVSLYPESSS